MISFFRTWCEGIIVAVVISIIIESILPEGNNKKYVKVIISIYIVFTILNPILGKVDANMDFSENFNFPSIETSSTGTENIKKMYTKGIEETLKNDIEEKFGYKVNNIKIIYTEDYTDIEEIELKLQNTRIATVEPVKIGESQENNIDFSDVKKYISENYGILNDKILIN